MELAVATLPSLVCHQMILCVVEMRKTECGASSARPQDARIDVA